MFARRQQRQALRSPPFLDSFEAFNQAELRNVYIIDPDWNDHYALGEVANALAIIAFSFEFDPVSGDSSVVCLKPAAEYLRGQFHSDDDHHE
jgi:hypothetical protein